MQNANKKRSWLPLAALAVMVLGGGGFALCNRAKDGANERGDERTGAAASDRGQGVGVPASAAVQGEEAGLGEAGASATPGGFHAFFGWGSGKNQLGRDRPQEANPEAPMSFSLLPNGGMLILDQVNNRMVLTDKDGKPVRELDPKLTAPQDVAVGKDGSMAVVDRLVDKRVSLFDAQGNPVGSLPLEGNKIREGGGVSGLFVDGNKVYAEKEHGMLYLLGSTDGTPSDSQTTLMGRPSKDGKLLLSAGITSAVEGRVWVSAMHRAETREAFTREFKEPVPVLSIQLLDTDARGTIYFGYVSEVGEESHRLLVHCLAPNDGHILGSIEMPLTEQPEETFRDFQVGDDGTIYHAENTEQGMGYRTAHCP